MRAKIQETGVSYEDLLIRDIPTSIRLAWQLTSTSRSLRDSKTCQVSLRTFRASLRSVETGVKSVSLSYIGGDTHIFCRQFLFE